MKPQCETTADCLEHLARVMLEFGFTSAFEAIGSGFVKYKFVLDPRLIPTFSEPELWSFAIAKLEDEPVFIGDTVYSEFGKHTVLAVSSGNNLLLSRSFMLPPENLSWTPPKQTVSLKVGDNEPVEVEKAWLCVAHYNPDRSGKYVTEYHHETYEAAEQFRKAMKPLVKE